MPVKKLSKFCSLDIYLKHKYPDLHQALADSCALGLLRPTRNSSGITLLIPADKKYVEEIVNSAYSSDPIKAHTMMKALILQGHYSSPSEFDKNVINRLNQKVDVESANDKEVKLAGGLVLKQDTSFETFRRDNMAVFILSGKGRMPDSNPVVSSSNVKQVKKGGSEQYKEAIQRLTEEEYKSAPYASCNAFMQKVYIQLNILLKQEKISSEILQCMGNEEISDSYLLDVYCSEHCPEVFPALAKCLESPDGKFPEALKASVSFESYISKKEEVIALVRAGPRQAPAQQDKLLQNIRSPIELRAKVIEEYAGNNKKLGKDMFIILVNICKDMWHCHKDALDMFDNLVYLIHNVYTNLESLASNEFDVARDLSLWGNLLKSDVFKHEAEARPSSLLKEVSEIPSPIHMTTYSMGKLQFNRSLRNAAKSGGASVELSKYL